MKHRGQKKKEMEALRADLERTQHVIVASFSGLTVEQDYELRKQVRGAGGKYRVVKNAVAELAARGTAAEGVLKGLTGPTALAYTEKEPAALAKVLTAYARANPALTFKAGLVEGRVISLAEISELASMPGKEGIIARLLYLVNAPARRLATTLGAVSRNLAVVVDQVVRENKFVG